MLGEQQRDGILFFIGGLQHSSELNANQGCLGSCALALWVPLLSALFSLRVYLWEGVELAN